MLFDDASLYNKLIELRNSGVKQVIWNWNISFIVDGTTYQGINLIDINRFSDFTKNYSDLIFVSAHISQTLYNTVLLPNKDNLKIKITKTANNIVGNTERVANSYSETFNAFITEPSNSFVMSTSNKVENSLTNDLSSFATVTFQLVDEAAYEVRLTEVGGTYKGCTMTDLLRGLLTYNVVSKNSELMSVDMVPANNTREYYQIVIPNGIRKIKLAAYLQKKYGIYSSGVGAYIYRGQWYIFPLLNHQRFNTTTKTLTILNVPKKDMGVSDVTYIENEDSLFVFSSGDIAHIDKSEHILNNVGRGVKYSIGSNLIDGFRDANGNVNEIPAERNSVFLNTEDSKNGFQNIHAQPGLLTDNPYTALSNVAAGMASMIVVRWEFSTPELLYPGMPVKILYKKDNIVQTLMGTLIKISCNTANWVSNVTDKKYITVTEMSILAERVT